MDPRSSATPEILQQQLELGQQMFADTLEARRALAEISSVQEQLAEAEQKLGEQNPDLKSALTNAQSEILTIITHKQEQPAELKDGYTNLVSALRVVEGGDRSVPSQAIALYKEARQRIKGSIAEWTKFKQTTLLQLNQRFREGGLAPIRDLGN
jgi:hypothetical protein